VDCHRQLQLRPPKKKKQAAATNSKANSKKQREPRPVEAGRHKFIFNCYRGASIVAWTFITLIMLCVKERGKPSRIGTRASAPKNGVLGCTAVKAKPKQRMPGSMNLNRPLQGQERKLSQIAAESFRRAPRVPTRHGAETPFAMHRFRGLLLTKTWLRFKFSHDNFLRFLTIEGSSECESRRSA
jgi:hypothetical protein